MPYGKQNTSAGLHVDAGDDLVIFIGYLSDSTILENLEVADERTLIGKTAGFFRTFHVFVLFFGEMYICIWTALIESFMKAIGRLCASQSHGRLTLPPLAPD